MKKLIMLAAMVIGMLGVSYSAQASDEWIVPGGAKVECKYSVLDAMAGTKTFVVSGFIPKQTSDDGKRVLGMVLFHNPDNDKKESVDAIALAVLDKENPDENQVILLVSYYHETTQTTTTYKRRFETVKGKQTLSQCFEKTTEKVNQK